MPATLVNLAVQRSASLSAQRPEAACPRAYSWERAKTTPFSLCYSVSCPLLPPSSQMGSLSPPQCLPVPTAEAAFGGVWLLGLTVPTPWLDGIQISRAPKGVREGLLILLFTDPEQTLMEGTYLKWTPLGGLERSEKERKVQEKGRGREGNGEGEGERRTKLKECQARSQTLSHVIIPTIVPSRIVTGHHVPCLDKKMETQTDEKIHSTKTYDLHEGRKLTWSPLYTQSLDNA